MRHADFWDTEEDGKIVCSLCPHECRLTEGQTGLCGVRTVHDARLVPAGYGLVSSCAVDPIEKKPLYHFRPGSDIFSIGGWGCNLACSFCQNWTISQQVADSPRRYSASDIVGQLRESGTSAIAYTYNEPLIAHEFVRDCAVKARDEGFANVLVTNGYTQKAAAEAILSVIDALNIDIKSMDDDFYRKYCRGTLAPVLAFAAQAREAGAHVEITNLVIPGHNDELSNIRALAGWIATNLGKHTPLHLSAYHPQYKFRTPATRKEALMNAWRAASEDLPFVYMGNVMSEQGRDTHCLKCGAILIERRGYASTITGIVDGRCRSCGSSDLHIRF